MFCRILFFFIFYLVFIYLCENKNIWCCGWNFYKCDVMGVIEGK